MLVQSWWVLKFATHKNADGDRSHIARDEHSPTNPCPVFCSSYWLEEDTRRSTDDAVGWNGKMCSEFRWTRYRTFSWLDAKDVLGSGVGRLKDVISELWVKGDYHVVDFCWFDMSEIGVRLYSWTVFRALATAALFPSICIHSPFSFVFFCFFLGSWWKASIRDGVYLVYWWVLVII